MSTWSVLGTGAGLISEEYEYSRSIREYRLYRISASFEVSGDVNFYSSGSDVDTMGYIGTTSSWYSDSGTPKYYDYDDDDSGSGNNFDITFYADAGTTYYFWYRAYGENDTGSTTIHIVPPVPAWPLTSNSLSTITSGVTKNITLNQYDIYRYSVSYYFSGEVTFYTTGSVDTYGYLSDEPWYDGDSGVPLSYLASDDDSGDGNNFSITYNVSANTTYYLFVRGYNSKSSGSVSVVIGAPPVVWSVSGSNIGSVGSAYSKEMSFNLYETQRNSVSFPYSGTATFYTSGSNVDTYGTLSTNSTFDSSNGNAYYVIARDDDSGEGNNFSLSYSVSANTTYYIFVRSYSGTSTSSSTLWIDPPHFSTSSSTISSISTTTSESITVGAWVMRRYTLTFAYSGAVTFLSSGSGSFVAYLSSSGSYTTYTGIPTSYVASDTDGGNFNFSYNVTKDTTYYLFVRTYQYDSSYNVTISIIPYFYKATISYDANGGSGAPSGTSVSSSSDTFSYFIPNTIPTKENNSFVGWLYNGTLYNAGTTYSLPASFSGTSITFVAQWEQLSDGAIWINTSSDPENPNWVAGQPYIYSTQWDEGSMWLYDNGWHEGDSTTQ